MTSTRQLDPVTAAVRHVVDRLGPGLYGVACSGGADSVALAHATIAVVGAPHVVVLTIDHQLTFGSARVADEVSAWARGQGAAAVVRAVAVVPRASIEAAAREARYAALDALADELGLVGVLLGHTARDQAETVMMRVLRGTGPAGIAAIPPARGRFVRPLLALPRAATEGYVAAHALPTWHDPMNDDLTLARVRIRREILPLLRRENPQLDQALVRLASSAAEWLAVIDAQARRFATFPIGCAGLAREPAAIRKRAISLALDQAAIDYDATHLDRIDELVLAPDRGEVALDVPGGRVVRRYDRLELAGPAPARSALQAPTGYLLRVWSPGDRMRPARLRGKSRKLSDLFIDAKVPRQLRATARVLVRATDDVIVWVEHLGHAFDETVTPTQMGGSF
jgi:tRNA(Ile)-lysidine synthase